MANFFREDFHHLVVDINKDSCEVYVGRGSPWGNPFVIGVDGDRKEVLKKYRTYLSNRPDLVKRLPELKGKTLGCFCAPLPCHGHLLAELANKE